MLQRNNFQPLAVENIGASHALCLVLFALLLV